MVRFRKLQRKGQDNVWHNDAYAIEMDDGKVVLRYSLAWEHLGGYYNEIIQEQHVSLEQLEEVLSGESVRWMPVEELEADVKQAIEVLDPECNVPSVTSANVRQYDAPSNATGRLITLQAQVISGRLQLQTPPTGSIRVYGDHIYLEDGRQLQIRLVPSSVEQGA